MQRNDGATFADAPKHAQGMSAVSVARICRPSLSPTLYHILELDVLDNITYFRYIRYYTTFKSTNLRCEAT